MTTPRTASYPGAVRGLFYSLSKHNRYLATVLQRIHQSVIVIYGYTVDHHDALLGMLTDKQKETLEKFDDCYAELTDINEREIFVYAFRLGMRIAIAVFTEPERQ